MTRAKTEAPLLSRLRGDLNESRRNRDRERILVLSTVISEVRNDEISGQRSLDDEGVLAVVARGIKKRRDAAEQARKLDRSDMAEAEEAQARILQAYLPAALSAEEVRALARGFIAEGAGQMGEVMRRLMPKLRGRFDGREASQIVQDELQAGSPRPPGTPS